MKNKLVFLAALTVLLAAGLVLTGCDDGGGGGGGGAVLTITGVSEAQYQEGEEEGWYGLFPVGTSAADVHWDLSQARSEQNTSYMVAGGNSYSGEAITKKTTLFTYTTIVLLRDAKTGFKTRWNGEPGTYDIWIELTRRGGGDTDYVAAGQTVAGSITISSDKFIRQSPFQP